MNRLFEEQKPSTPTGEPIPTNSATLDRPTLTQAASISAHRWSQSLSGGAHVLIRPINRLDASAERGFIDGLPSDTKRLHFTAQIQRSTEKYSALLSPLDAANEVTLVAVVKDGAAEKIVGMARYSNDVAHNRCECALAVGDDWHHKGLGTALMKHLIELARINQIAAMQSRELAENLSMRTLLHELDFHVQLDPHDARLVIYTLELKLTSDATETAPPP